jgi:pimeloyl-ACP methyl ester carboxylesterase
MRTHDGDLIVLLPGILGSTLRRGDHQIWGFGGLARNLLTLSRTLTENLSLPSEAFDDQEFGFDDGTVADDLLQSKGTIPPRGLGVMIPGFWSLIDGYDLLVDKLQRTFDPRDVLKFPYDWRQSNRVSARWLQKAVEPLIRHRRATYPNAHLIFIGHSMGGLVARYYAEVLDREYFTGRVVTIGTPYQGAAKALGVLTSDYVRLAAGVRFKLGPLARSLPSVAELLPVYPCLGNSSDDLQTLADVDDVPGLERLHREHAVDFHAEIDRRIEANGEDRAAYTAILSYRQLTDTWASIEDDGLRLHRPDALHSRGDGTVPRVSAVPSEWPPQATANFTSGRHAALQQTTGAWEQIRGVLTGAPYRRPMAEPFEVIADVPDFVAVDEELTIEAQVANSDELPGPPEALALVVSIACDEGRSTSVPLRWDGDAYRAGLRLTTAGTYRWAIEADPYGVSSVVPASDVFFCAQP